MSDDGQPVGDGFATDVKNLRKQLIIQTIGISIGLFVGFYLYDHGVLGVWNFEYFNYSCFGYLVMVLLLSQVLRKTIGQTFFPLSEEWIARRKAEEEAREKAWRNEREKEKRLAKEEKEKRLAEKPLFSKKKVMFGLWEREMTPMEKINQIAMGAAKSGDYELAEKIVGGLRGSGRGEREHDDRKASLIDVAEVLTRFRCVECDTPMEGGPYKGTNLCPHCGFMFDSKGNAINPK